MEHDLTTPRYRQPDVLRIAGLKEKDIQTWLARGALKVQQQTPGRGRVRLYSPCEVVAAAVMGRLKRFRIDLGVMQEIADAAVATLLSEGMDWFFLLRVTSFEGPKMLRVGGQSALNRYGAIEGDWHVNRVSQIIEPPTWLGRRRNGDPESDDYEMDDKRRDYLARQGYHAEPVLLFPIGEIVNGTLQQLWEIDDNDDL